MIFFKKYKVHWQKFQKYDYYFFQLKWSLCQRTERWGERAGRQQGRVVVGPRWRCRVWQRTVIGQSWRSCFSCQTEEGSSGAQEEVLCCGAAAWHPEDHSKEALSGHSPTPTPLWLSHRLTGWLTDWLTGQRVSETADIASLVPPNRTRLTILE